MDELRSPAHYGYYGNEVAGNYRSTVGWNDLVDPVTGEMRIVLRESVLNSDEAIIASVAHEMHEVNALKEMLAEGRRIRYVDFVDAVIDNRPGNLHDQAWDAANQLVNDIFGPPLPNPGIH